MQIVVIWSMLALRHGARVSSPLRGRPELRTSLSLFKFFLNASSAATSPRWSACYSTTSSSAANGSTSVNTNSCIGLYGNVNGNKNNSESSKSEPCGRLGRLKEGANGCKSPDFSVSVDMERSSGSPGASAGVYRQPAEYTDVVFKWGVGNAYRAQNANRLVLPLTCLMLRCSCY